MKSYCTQRLLWSLQGRSAASHLHLCYHIRMSNDQVIYLTINCSTDCWNMFRILADFPATDGMWHSNIFVRLHRRIQEQSCCHSSGYYLTPCSSFRSLLRWYNKIFCSCLWNKEGLSNIPNIIYPFRKTVIFFPLLRFIYLINQVNLYSVESITNSVWQICATLLLLNQLLFVWVSWTTA